MIDRWVEEQTLPLLTEVGFIMKDTKRKNFGILLLRKKGGGEQSVDIQI
jgi:hypothetical protein